MDEPMPNEMEHFKKVLEQNLSINNFQKDLQKEEKKVKADKILTDKDLNLISETLKDLSSKF